MNLRFTLLIGFLFCIPFSAQDLQQIIEKKKSELAANPRR